MDYQTSTWYHINDTAEMDVQKDLVTATVLDMYIKCSVGIRVLICLGGLFMNTLNIRAFLRLGIDDSVTMAFFVLAISDFVFLFCSGINGLCQVTEILEKELGLPFVLKPFTVNYFVSLFGRLFFNVSNLVTAFLAIQRCLCVIRPLHFRGMFTPFRTFMILFLIWAYAIVAMAIFLAQHGLRTLVNPITNASIIIFYLKAGYSKTAHIIYIMGGIILNVFRQTTIALSVCVMAYTLRKSVKFRKLNSALAAGGNDVKELGRSDSKTPDKGKNSSKTRLSSKETQAVIQVFLICIIYLIANVPYSAISVAGVLVPEFKLQGLLHNTYRMVSGMIMGNFELVSAAVNFFVYYNYNTRFREVCFKRKA